jgi:hypothetical protein
MARKRNPVARRLSDPRFRRRVAPNKLKYTRKGRQSRADRRPVLVAHAPV